MLDRAFEDLGMTPQARGAQASAVITCRGDGLAGHAVEADPMADMWNDEDKYWRDNYGTRPYGQGIPYDSLSGGYRYGTEAAHRHPGRGWDEVETDLERDWAGYEHRGESTWAQVKDAVRDAWDRMTGKHSST